MDAHDKAVERLAVLVGQDWIADSGKRLPDEEIARRILRDLSVSVGLVAIDPTLVEAVVRARAAVNDAYERDPGAIGPLAIVRDEAVEALADAVIAQIGAFP